MKCLLLLINFQQWHNQTWLSSLSFATLQKKPKSWIRKSKKCWGKMSVSYPNAIPEFITWKWKYPKIMCDMWSCTVHWHFCNNLKFLELQNIDAFFPVFITHSLLSAIEKNNIDDYDYFPLWCHPILNGNQIYKIYNII